MMTFKFTPEEEVYVRGRAKRLSMTVSDYLRYAALYEGAMGADPGAFKLLRRRALAKVRTLLVENLQPEMLDEGHVAG